MGHLPDPLEFPPEQFCGKGRYDHPGKAFRTLYCAESALTAFREVLADLRPNAAVRAEFLRVFGEEPPPRVVTGVWRRKRSLVQARLRVLQGRLVHTSDIALRQELEKLHPDLLAKYGLDHLDMAQLHSKLREVTQAITVFVASRGAAGVVYPSSLDNLMCVALFERRARLEPLGSAIYSPIPVSHPDLVRVCEEFGILLESEG